MPVKPVPDGFHTVTPVLSVKGMAGLIDFIKAAFGAQELMRFVHPDGTVMHAEMKIGDSIMMMGEPMEGCNVTPSMLYIYVPDADATYRAALGAGGQSIAELADQFWGDRAGCIQDPTGNKWWIASHVEDVDMEELTRRVQAQSDH
jgi:PhnB protein